MFISIRTKLVLVITFLVLFISVLTAVLFIQEKTNELTRDIYVRAKSFAELTAEDIVKNYELYIQKGGFLYFDREIADIFLKNDDIPRIRIASYDGSILYDSLEEKDVLYNSAPDDVIQDQSLISRIQAKNASFQMTTDRRIVFMKRSENSQVVFTDINEHPTAGITNQEKIVDIVYPIFDQYAVIYDVSYQNLHDRIASTTERIVLLSIFGIMLGLLVSYVLSTQISRHLIYLTEGARAISQGNFSKRVVVRSRDEIGLLSDTFNKMAEDLETSTQAKVYKERVAKELELASQIQRELLPKRVPKVAGLEIAAGIIPAEEVGGDCFDFIHASQKDLVIYIGDVTGHGVPSGLVVAVANAVVYSLVYHRDIRDVLIHTNKILKEKISSNMFLTMLMVNWNSETKKLTYVSAGHERILHVKCKKSDIEQLAGGGMALGMLPDISKLLKEHTVDFQVGDVLVLYSDGLTEARCPKGEMYGLNRLQKILKSVCTLSSAEAVKNAILSDVKEFMGKVKQLDDITLLVLTRVPSEGS